MALQSFDDFLSSHLKTPRNINQDKQETKDSEEKPDFKVDSSSYDLEKIKNIKDFIDTR